MNIPRRKVYDVCVVGSGAAGGFLAKELTEAGAKVILLEAGRKIDPASLGQHDYPYELEGRARKAGRQSPLVPDFARYEHRGPDHAGLSLVRALGGRTLHWNAAVFRFSEDDFRERSLHGVEEDWPLTYQELAPFYSYVERLLPVCGTRENLRELPDGEFYAAPPAMRCSEQLAKRACRKLGIRMIPTRRALLIGRRAPNRAPCHFCGHCMQVCDVGAIFTSANTTLPLAAATGNLTLRTNALAREVLVDARGRASGVSFVSTATGREETVRARIVIVSCATVESARLLLNSRSERFPNGLANSNDVVGRYLHGHLTAGVTGYLREFVGTAPVNNDGANDHGLIPRFNHLRGARRDYVGGFQVQTQYLSFMHPHHARTVPGIGAAFKRRVRDLHPALLYFGGFGKVMARPENRVTVDGARVDQFGIPIPQVEFAYGDNDYRLFRDIVENITEIFHVAEADIFAAPPAKPAGFASHEVGTCRMGRDRRTSVLDSYCRTHEVPNLFVVDGSCFTTMPEKNPTLTIMALAVRSARHIIGERRKGNL